MAIERITTASEALRDGVARATVAAILQRQYGISRATAYRTIRDAERTLPPEFHQLAGTAGTIDTLAEAQRHYEAALLANDAGEVRRWLTIVHRFQLDTARTAPMDCWEISQGSDALPF